MLVCFILADILLPLGASLLFTGVLYWVWGIPLFTSMDAWLDLLKFWQIGLLVLGNAVVIGKTSLLFSC